MKLFFEQLFIFRDSFGANSFRMVIGFSLSSLMMFSTISCGKSSGGRSLVPATSAVAGDPADTDFNPPSEFEPGASPDENNGLPAQPLDDENRGDKTGDGSREALEKSEPAAMSGSESESDRDSHTAPTESLNSNSNSADSQTQPVKTANHAASAKSTKTQNQTASAETDSTKPANQEESADAKSAKSSNQTPAKNVDSTKSANQAAPAASTEQETPSKSSKPAAKAVDLSFGELPAYSVEKRPLRVLQVQLGGAQVFNLLKQELSLPIRAGGAAIAITEIRMPDMALQNPFAISAKNYQLPVSQNEFVISEKDAEWFAEQIRKNQIPDVFYIGGHHVPGLGFHTTYVNSLSFYEQTVTTSTLFASMEKYPAVRKYFASIPLVFLGGCWSLANLEPHGKNGEFLSPEDIRKIYSAGPEGRRAVVGSSKDSYTLEAQRVELSANYPSEFTRDERNEECEDAQQRKNCRTYHVDRVMSDYGLFDGSHRYNSPLLMKKMFPGAHLIFGFHSPSPFNPQVATFYRAMFQDTRRKTKESGNLLRKILDPATPEDGRKSLIQNLRQSWSKATYELNQKRPAGSVTPKHPELDASGPFVNFGVPNILRNYPYEKR